MVVRSAAASVKSCRVVSAAAKTKQDFEADKYRIAGKTTLLDYLILDASAANMAERTRLQLTYWKVVRTICSRLLGVKVKHAIMELLAGAGLVCFEEVYAVDDDGTSWFADIVTFEDGSNRAAFISDPTVRFESYDPDQAELVDKVKKNIYEKCASYFRGKYSDVFGHSEFQVHGLWFGA